MPTVLRFAFVVLGCTQLDAVILGFTRLSSLVRLRFCRAACSVRTAFQFASDWSKGAALGCPAAHNVLPFHWKRTNCFKVSWGDLLSIQD